MDADKRETERLPMLGELHGEIMVFQPMAVTEISLTGVAVETAFPLHLDSLHELRLSLGERSVVLKGRVVHSHISDIDGDTVRYRNGIEFVEPSDHAAAAIGAFLDAVRAHRRGES
jgi:hypothetical protein